MPPIEILSTTDSPTNVQAALGQKTEPAKEAGANDPKGQSAVPDPKASEQKQVSKSDTETPKASDVDPEDDHDAEETDAGESESEPGEDKAAKSSEEGEKDKPKRKSGYQRKVDKLTARISAERQRADLLEARLSQLERGKSDLDGGKQIKAEAAPVDPKDPEPKEDQFEKPSDYYKALSAWSYRQERRADDAKSKASKAEDEFKQTVKTHQERVDQFAQAHDDYPEVMENLSDVPNSPAMAEYIVTSENGPALLYELGKNPEEAKRIAKLPPAALRRELAKVEVRIEAQAPKNTGKEAGSGAPAPEPKNKTKAPKPLNPVSSSGAVSVDKDIYRAESMSQKEYEAVRAKQRAEAARAG